jgi:AAA15 family ATPase/GTPase
MQSIVLKNFKSYEQQAVNDLNSRINVILGSNGQGKSNFLKGILLMIIKLSRFCLLIGLRSIKQSLTQPCM